MVQSYICVCVCGVSFTYRVVCMHSVSFRYVMFMYVLGVCKLDIGDIGMDVFIYLGVL